MWVRVICGHCREERELKEGDLNDEELKFEKFRCEISRLTNNVEEAQLRGYFAFPQYHVYCK